MFHFPFPLMFPTVGVLLAVIFSVALLLTPKPKRRWTKVTGVVVFLVVFGLLLVMHWFEPPMYQVHSEDEHVVAAFAPDGKTLILGGSEKIEVWDVDSRKVTATFQGHSDSILCLAFNPDGTLLATGCRDNTVKLWKWPEVEEVATLKGHTGKVNCVAFSPDGQVLATAGQTATPGPNDSFFHHAPILRLWDVARWRARAEMSPSSNDCSRQAIRLISQTLFPARVSSLKTSVYRSRSSRTVATHLLDAGTDLVVIQALLGHSSIKTTNLPFRPGRRVERSGCLPSQLVLSGTVLHRIQKKQQQIDAGFGKFG